MSEKTSLKSPSKRIRPLVRLIGKAVKVLGVHGWTGRVTEVIDEENILVSKDGEPVKVSIFDVRSV